MDYTPYIETAKREASVDPAHDFLHVQRVYNHAKLLLQTEQADEDVVLVSVLLHELFNYPKGHPESHLSGDVCAERAEVVLHEQGFPAEKIPHVLDCIRNHSFSKGVMPATIEGKLVQDADRLDSLGAIGIARCFATCAEMERPFYEPGDPFSRKRKPNDKEYGLDHFYVKLLKIADRMHTEAGRRIAKERTRFMELYLSQLKQEI
ncbi:HD domain-containing protein [Aneurinibacillus terranovensis]|uniref:HD domain-containing protein n=1 Tax=Aneurinibacillus terranovensis TaxID=278991 RepID=UPI00040D93A6|nr:HD domain-containing protein [Aneurinibacillus terranovensis]